MSTVQQTAKLIIACILFLFMSGCSSKLSRDKAKEEIIKAYSLPHDETMEANLASIEKSVEYYHDSRDDNYLLDSLLYFLNLQKAGLITYSIEKTYSWTDTRWSDEAVTTGIGSFGGLGTKNRFFTRERFQHIGVLTDVGKKYDAGNGNVKVATIEFGEITGIIENKDLHAAEVNYTVKRTGLTPFGKAFNLNESTYNRNATFVKYDDGWRIDKNGN